MALENFENLKPKKKELILQAIAKQLAEKDYDNLSINDIAEEAEISRGSFYNYFVDKNDAVMTLVGFLLNDVEKYFKKEIIETNGDLFLAAREAYEHIKNYFNNEKSMNTILNMKFFTSVIMNIIYSKSYEKRMDDLIEWLIENTEDGKTYLNTKKKMSNVLGMITLLMAEATAKMMLKTEANIKYYDFNYKLNLIKFGATADNQ